MYTCIAVYTVCRSQFIFYSFQFKVKCRDYSVFLLSGGNVQLFKGQALTPYSKSIVR